jgi:hypothetical protein
MQSKAMQSNAKVCKAKQSNAKQCIAKQCKAMQSKCGFWVEEPGSGASRNPGGGPVRQGPLGNLFIYIYIHNYIIIFVSAFLGLSALHWDALVLHPASRKCVLMFGLLDIYIYIYMSAGRCGRYIQDTSDLCSS